MSLVSAAILGMVLVITVFAHDPSPWHDLFSRGTDHAIGNLSAAFAFFALSDVIAQVLPKEQENRRMGRSIGDRLQVNSFRAIRCGVLGPTLQSVRHATRARRGTNPQTPNAKP